MDNLKNTDWGQVHLGNDYLSIRIDKREGTPVGLEEIVNRRLLKYTDNPEGRIYKKAVRALQNTVSVLGNAAVRFEAFPAKIKIFPGDNSKPGVLIVGRNEDHSDPATTGEHVIALTFGKGLSLLEAQWVRDLVSNDDFCFTFISSNEGKELPGQLAVEAA